MDGCVEKIAHLCYPCPAPMHSHNRVVSPVTLLAHAVTTGRVTQGKALKKDVQISQRPA